MGSELVLPLGDILYYNPGILLNFQLIVVRPPGSKVRHTNLVGYLLIYTIVVPPSGYFEKFLSPTSGIFPSYLLISTLTVPIYGA